LPICTAIFAYITFVDALGDWYLEAWILFGWFPSIYCTKYTNPLSLYVEKHCLNA
jgi:hypothetical protein